MKKIKNYYLTDRLYVEALEELLLELQTTLNWTLEYMLKRGEDEETKKEIDELNKRIKEIESEDKNLDFSLEELEVIESFINLNGYVLEDEEKGIKYCLSELDFEMKNLVLCLGDGDEDYYYVEDFDKFFSVRADREMYLYNNIDEVNESVIQTIDFWFYDIWRTIYYENTENPNIIEELEFIIDKMYDFVHCDRLREVYSALDKYRNKILRDSIEELEKEKTIRRQEINKLKKEIKELKRTGKKEKDKDINYKIKELRKEIKKLNERKEEDIDWEISVLSDMMIEE